VHGPRPGIEFTNAPMMRLLGLGRHLVPAPWRARLRNVLFSIRGLRFTRPSGVRLRIANDTDWTVYTEVFRKGEYDAAISRAVTSTRSGRLCIVDLGANVGFFTLRVIDAIRTLEPRSRDLAITAVEGSPGRVEEFRSRVLVENGLRDQVQVINGLVGNRAGTAVLYEGRSHGDTSLFERPESSARGDELEFVDLSQRLASEPIIHLLKCDIEGAELQFIQTYRDLLLKTEVAVFELHDDLCDTESCRRLLRDYGFGYETVVRRTGPYEIHCVWR
jgi:FkbM family methyltransferase